MKVSEFRIDNLVQTKEGTEVNIFAFALLHWETESKFYEPIKLTPEWLERMGFYKTKEERHIFSKWDEYRLFDHGVDFDLFNDPPHHEFIYEGTGLRNVHIQYVHQLQNLYFTLLGEELTIKELTSL